MNVTEQKTESAHRHKLWNSSHTHYTRSDSVLFTGWLLTKWHFICASLMVLLMESSKTDMGFIKVCARCIPKQLTGEHKDKCLTACPGLLSCYCVEGVAFWGALLLGMRHGSTIMIQKANTTLWNGNKQHCQSKRGSKLNRGWEKWCWHYLGCTGPILEHYQESSTTVNSVH
jgi:hypothetical protein